MRLLSQKYINNYNEEKYFLGLIICINNKDDVLDTDRFELIDV